MKILALVLVTFDTSQVAENTSSNHAFVLVALTQVKLLKLLKILKTMLLSWSLLTQDKMLKILEITKIMLLSWSH
jgi:hypothetical protein